LPEDSKKSIDGRPISKLELKRVLSAKLRDPDISVRSFVSMLAIYVKLNPGWKRKLRQTKADPSVDDIVRQLEKQRQRHTKPI
jgi:hypothetical protein